MFGQIKELLIKDYTNQIAQYDLLKAQLEEMEEKIKNDPSEEEYKGKLAELNKKYNVFKRGKKYKEELNNINSEYFSQLKEFEKKHNEYLDIRSQASQINIYALQKKLEQLNNATSLEDIKMTEEEAQRIIAERS